MRSEGHFSHRTGWLRAAVLGAADGIVSTASLMLGVAASSTSRNVVLIAGIAGLAAGAMSMAAGEFVSVGSQRDTERADFEREAQHLALDPVGEREELERIYRGRGLSPALARAVAVELSKGDRLRAHARDELGLEEGRLARPTQAAAVSAASFAAGAGLPLAAAWLAPSTYFVAVVVGTTVVSLSLLGGWGAQAGGAPKVLGALRVASGGGLAMAVTSLVGKLAGLAGI